MIELNEYCQRNSNDADVRQARMMRNYIIATLLNVRASDTVRFYSQNDVCYREAFYS